MVYYLFIYGSYKLESIWYLGNFIKISEATLIKSICSYLGIESILDEIDLLVIEHWIHFKEIYLLVLGH
jgi:hypothetical protein